MPYNTPLAHNISRIQELLYLSFAFASNLLQAEEEEELIATTLVAITAGEGLGFNRAFFLEKVPDAYELKGRWAVGPASLESAQIIWQNLQKERPSFQEIVDRVLKEIKSQKFPLKSLIDKIYVSLIENHSLTRALEKNQAILLKREKGLEHIFDLLKVEEIAAVPLSVPLQKYGILMADNFITKKPIEESNLQFLQMMGSLTSLALHRLNICQELEEKKCLLVEAERLTALGQLSSKIFHEIRNPVSAIGGLSRLLLKKELNKEVQKYLMNIIQEVERLEKIMEDLLEFIRPIDLRPQPIGLFHLLQTSLTLLNQDFRKAGIRVCLDLTSQDPVICVDIKEMQLALIHLLKNALEAMPNGGILRVSVKIKKGIEIAIIDSGLGIPKAYLNRVMEPFFTTKIYGSGLGLSVAKRIIELHKGSLFLEQIKPSGTKVTIKLPAQTLCQGENK